MKKIKLKFFLLVVLCFIVCLLKLKENFLLAAHSEELIIAHISDSHFGIQITPSVGERFLSLLNKMKMISPLLLISTGDQINTPNDTSAYREFKQVFDRVGGFYLYPSNPEALEERIPVMAVSGNHDGWEFNNLEGDYFKKIHSFTLGNFRFIGFNYDFRYGLKNYRQVLENELKKSCEDQKPIIVYYHYGPYNPAKGAIGIPQAAWDEFVSLLNQYPVIGYLSGHVHYTSIQPFASGFVAMTISAAYNNAANLISLKNQNLNINPICSSLAILGISPSQYFPGLDYTKTQKGELQVKAYIKSFRGNVGQPYYQLDSSPRVNLNRLGGSDFFVASLDARNLNGQHTLKIGTTADVNCFHQMLVFFVDNVPPKINLGCSSQSVTPTVLPSPTSMPTPTVIPSIAPTPTASPTLTPTPNSGCYRPCQTSSDCPVNLVCGYNFYWGEKRCHNQYCPLESTCVCSWQKPLSF